MTMIEAGTRQTFRRQGDYWSVVFDGEVAYVRDTKGMGYLRRLLVQPGREIHVVDLAEAHAVPGDHGPALDDRAKASYRRRLRDLAVARSEAERDGDAIAAEAVEWELDYLRRELAGAVGLSGRDRVCGAASERARQAVTKSIKAATTRIAGHCPNLGAHLAATIRTGTYCVYLPDPRLPTEWSA